MLLNFDDDRPDTPRIRSALSRPSGVLFSLGVHAVLLLAVIFAPLARTGEAETPVEMVRAITPPDQAPMRFVEVVPLREMPAPPRLPADASDLDRRSATIDQAPEVENLRPYLEGNTPEMVVGGPTVRSLPAGPPAAEPTPEAAVPAEEVPDEDGALALDVRPPEPPAPPGNEGSGAFDNLAQYLRADRFDNRRGGQTDQSADIQFDTMGVDFGSWLLQFKRQVERNWIVPAAAMNYRGRTVIRFFVHRTGRISELEVVQPASVPALTSAAINALRLSNPTAALPAEYPVDRMAITVTFHYNEYF